MAKDLRFQEQHFLEVLNLFSEVKNRCNVIKTFVWSPISVPILCEGLRLFSSEEYKLEIVNHITVQKIIFKTLHDKVQLLQMFKSDSYLSKVAILLGKIRSNSTVNLSSKDRLSNSKYFLMSLAP